MWNITQDISEMFMFLKNKTDKGRVSSLKESTDTNAVLDH
jgi:hypothetical protein